MQFMLTITTMQLNIHALRGNYAIHTQAVHAIHAIHAIMQSCFNVPLQKPNHTAFHANCLAVCAVQALMQFSQFM